MNQELSLHAESLVDYARGRAGEAVTAEALRGWVADMRLPEGVIDALPFGAQVRQRWDSAVDNRVAELAGVRDRLGHTASGLFKAAADFERADIAAAVELAHTVCDDDLRPLLNSRFAGRVVMATGPDEAGPRLDFAAVHTEGEVPTTLDPNFETDTPGRPRLRALRAEHLSTLTRAEELLSGAQRLDFKRPTEYLNELEKVRPGALRTRAELVAIAASTVAQSTAAAERQTRQLSQTWRGGEASVAFAGHAEATAGYTRAVGTELAWLRDQGERLWRIVDGLLCDVADDAELVVEAVQDSRIGRIRQAVDLLDDAQAHAPSPDGASAWGWYSGADVDTVVQVLYKRVWYLSNAFRGSVDRAGQAAQSLLDNGRHPAVTVASTPGDGGDWTSPWSIGDRP